MRGIAVVTSGGDSPGMNAAVRAVVRACDAAGVPAVGVEGGFGGLVEGRLRPLDARSVSRILQRPGTMLGTGRCPAFRSSEARREGGKHLAVAEVDGLVVVGGVGSLRGADALSRETPVRVAGVPATIDNDVGGTDWSVGLDSAVNSALSAIDQIRDSASSEGRVFLVEVAGRHAGWVSLLAGLTSGASHVVVPERAIDLAALRADVRGAFDRGKGFCLVVVAEGTRPGGVYELAERLGAELDDIETRVSVLGQLQRGAAPTMRDRLLGSVLGDAAVDALVDGEDRVLLGERAGRIVRAPLSRAWTAPATLSADLEALMARLAR